MTDMEGFLSAKENAEQAQQRKLAGVRSQSRGAAVLTGRLLGEHEAARRGESGLEREQRIARAMGYAAWEWDGKPLGAGPRYAEEFGIPEPTSLPAQISNGGQMVPDLLLEDPGLLMPSKRCSRASRHHINHSGKPCPECGYPKEAP